MKTPPDDLAEKLYAATDRLLAEGPNVRIDDVARHVEVPRATLYYYFSGKDDLISFLMQQKLARAGEAVAKAIQSGGSTIERLGAALHALIEVMADQPGLCLNMVAAFGQAENFAAALRDAERAMAVPLRELLIEGRATKELRVDDVDRAVWAVIGALLIAVLAETNRPGTVDANTVADTVVPLLLDGLRA